MIERTHTLVGSRALVVQVAAGGFPYRVMFEGSTLAVFSDEQALDARLYAEAFNAGLQEGRRDV